MTNPCGRAWGTAMPHLPNRADNGEERRVTFWANRVSNVFVKNPKMRIFRVWNAYFSNVKHFFVESDFDQGMTSHGFRWMMLATLCYSRDESGNMPSSVDKKYPRLFNEWPPFFSQTGKNSISIINEFSRLRAEFGGPGHIGIGVAWVYVTTGIASFGSDPASASSSFYIGAVK